MTDREVLDLVTAQTEPGDHILLYTGSFAYATARPIIAEWAMASSVTEVVSFETLRVSRRRIEVRIVLHAGRRN